MTVLSQLLGDIKVLQIKNIYFKPQVFFQNYTLVFNNRFTDISYIPISTNSFDAFVVSFVHLMLMRLTIASFA